MKDEKIFEGVFEWLLKAGSEVQNMLLSLNVILRRTNANFNSQASLIHSRSTCQVSSVNCEVSLRLEPRWKGSKNAAA